MPRMRLVTWNVFHGRSPEDGRVDAVSVYGLGGREWRQPWTMHVLDDAALSALAATASLEVVGTDGAWVLLRGT